LGAGQQTGRPATPFYDSARLFARTVGGQKNVVPSAFTVTTRRLGWVGAMSSTTAKGWRGGGWVVSLGRRRNGRWGRKAISLREG